MENPMTNEELANRLEVTNAAIQAHTEYTTGQMIDRMMDLKLAGEKLPVGLLNQGSVSYLLNYCAKRFNSSAHELQWLLKDLEYYSDVAVQRLGDRIKVGEVWERDVRGLMGGSIVDRLVVAAVIGDGVAFVRPGSGERFNVGVGHLLTGVLRHVSRDRLKTEAEVVAQNVQNRSGIQ